MSKATDDRKIMEEAVAASRANQEQMEMCVREYAKVLRAAFLGLVSAGFTEVQALEIVKARGIS